jgi:hypothetical protein
MIAYDYTDFAAEYSFNGFFLGVLSEAIKSAIFKILGVNYTHTLNLKVHIAYSKRHQNYLQYG